MCKVEIGAAVVLFLTFSQEGEVSPGSEHIPTGTQSDKGEEFYFILYVAISDFCAA